MVDGGTPRSRDYLKESNVKKNDDPRKLVESLERGFSEYVNYLRDNLMRLQRIQVDLLKRVESLEKQEKRSN
jgi:hypothetical protein